MELALFIVGIVEVAGLPILLLVIAYKEFVPGPKGLLMLGKLFGIGVLYLVASGLLMIYMGGLMMAGAHSEPVGLSGEGQLMLFAAVLGYTITGWVMCSVIAWRPFGLPDRATETLRGR